MEIVLNKQQRDFLEKLKKLSIQDGTFEGPWHRIDNILKNGVYHDDKSSYYTPPKLGTQSDRYLLNIVVERYKKYKNPTIKL